MYDNSSFSQVDSFQNNMKEIITEDPKQIFKKYWGRYIGILYNAHTKAFTLVRDPLGLSTIFYCIRPQGIIFSTDLSCLYDVLTDQRELDLNYFAEYIINSNLALPLSPFKGIKELLPGTGLNIYPDGRNTCEFWWDITSLKYPFILDRQYFEEELLTTLKSCMKAWTSGCSGLCVELSGGTDSSAVTILAREVLPSNKKLICINYIDSQEPSSNEIEFAQEITRECNADLHFIDWQEHPILEGLPAGWRPNKPSTLILFYKKIQKIHDLAKQNNCSEIMNGQGGDHIFLAPPPKESLVDYWLDKGFGGITSPASQLISRYRMPWYNLAYDSLKTITRYYCGQKKTIKENLSFLSDDFIQQLPRNEFYLNHLLKNFHPGKADQIESLHHAIAYSERDQWMQGRTVTHPLISQPIIELALRIPTYQSFHDGFDRILFRQAVSRIKKPKALWRRSKGHTTNSIIKMYMNKADQIREIITEGKLFKSGMINNKWLERELTFIEHGHYTGDNWLFSHLLSSQVWLNQWNLT